MMLNREPNPTPTATKLPMWKLALQGYFALTVAIVLGVLASAPFVYTRIRCFNESAYIVEGFPPDDTALNNWGMSKPAVVSFRTERRGKELWIHSEYFALNQQPPFQDVASQLRASGYDVRGMRGIVTGMASRLPELLTDAQVLAVMLAAMQVAFGAIGLFRIRLAARKGEPLPPLFAGSQKQAIAIGLAGGVGLLGIGLLYDLALKGLLGYSPPSPWVSANAMPAATKLVFLFFGGLGAPLTEELFFRGYLFGKLKAAGYVWFGILFSSVLFGVVHISDPYGCPPSASTERCSPGCSTAQAHCWPRLPPMLSITAC